jgi:spermidine synthase
MTASRPLYALTVFLSALLLFLVEPMVAKQLLPQFGGASAVWITCLVFFQSALFLGYLYAHLVSTRLAPPTQRTTHLAALALSLAALALRTHINTAPDTTHPFFGVLTRLALLIGVPFIVLSATNPLLQSWLARAYPHSSFYRFYALSNAGSLIALAMYPGLVEPRLTMRSQSAWWAIGYLLFCALCATITWRVRGLGGTDSDPAASSEPETLTAAAHPFDPRLAQLLWFLLPACGSMALCSITSHLTQNIAAIPLLWVLPLGVYLFSYIVAFEFSALYRRGLIIRLLAIFLASLGYLLTKDTSMSIVQTLVLFHAGLFIACFFCHAELYALRPHARRLTQYYLLAAAGGAAGTLAIGVIAPLVFAANYDLVLAFLAIAAIALAVTWNDGWGQRLLWSAATAGMTALLAMMHLAYQHDSLALARNFYGTLRVRQMKWPQGGMLRTMLNGNVRHGTQLTAPSLRRMPTSYYAPDSGVGLALTFCCQANPRRIGVIGLGTGSVAVYGLKGDTIRFYEINPNVEPMARRYFTYLGDTPAAVSIVPGDARLSLASEPSQQFDVLVVDAFSGDSIPVHLLTREAMQIYLRHMRAGGIIAFHISNQYVDLAPVIGALARDSAWTAAQVHTFPNEVTGELAADWILVTGNRAFLEQPEVRAAIKTLDSRPGFRMWTDDFSSLLPLMRGPHEP